MWTLGSTLDNRVHAAGQHKNRRRFVRSPISNLTDDLGSGRVVVINKDSVEVNLRDSVEYRGFFCVNVGADPGNAEYGFHGHGCGSILAEHKSPEPRQHDRNL